MNMTIGNQLKKARQKKQVTLNEVYQQTRILPDLLNAMEEDRFKGILTPAYVRSFLKEYAAYLGIDVGRILSEYDTLSPQERPKAAEPALAKRAFFAGVDLTKTAKYAVIIAASILALIILISSTRGVVRRVSNISRQRALRAKELKSAKTQKPAKVIPAESVRDKDKIQKAPQKSAAKDVSHPAGKVAVPSAERLTLTVTATDDVWMQLKADGRIIFQNVLKKGASEKWEADSNFTIWTGKAGAMLLKLNGNDLETPGKGVRRDIVITREGIKR